MEQTILMSMLANRSTYELFQKIGSWDSFSPIGRAVGEAISGYYELDHDVRSCSLDVVTARLLGRVTNNKHEAPLREYLESLRGDISVSNVEQEIREINRRSVGGKLSLALANGANQEELSALIQAYEAGGLDRGRTEESRTDRIVDVWDTSDLTTGENTNVNYIKLWPKQLNDRLDGGALRGHHVLVFARPEAGKTLFAINLCAGFLSQQLSVLYIGNEEPIADIRDRLRARVLRTTKTSVRIDREATARRLAAIQLGTLKIAGDVTTFAGVRRAMGSHSSDVLIIDQLRNMRISADSKNAQLELAASAAREIAKDFDVLVVSITQAGDSATNKVYLEMNDVDNSKTGIPGAVDLMIGVGSDDAMKLNGLLGISLPKNKLGGDHSKFTVTANFQTGVIE